MDNELLFRQKLVETLEEYFPKGVSRERGAALMLMVTAIVEYRKLTGYKDEQPHE